MHVAVVTRNMRAGGAERVIAQLTKSWSEQGVQCSLVSVHPAEVFYQIPENVSYYEVPELAENGNLNKVRKYIYLRKLLKDLKPDVVLALPEEIGVYVILAMLGTGVPVVVSERNNPWVMPDRKITRVLRRLMYPFAKGLIFQTQQAASFFPASQQKKGIVLPNPLDISRLPEPYRGNREKAVVGAGRLEPQKNFPLLIEAFAKFYETHPDYKLVIYGEGNKRQELEALAAERLPEDAWSMPGRVDNLPERISQCGIFALSSDYEGMPNVLIEAMAMGTSAVSADCAPGGAAALIDSGENGLIVPVGDVDALAQALTYMADHPAEAARMAENAILIRQKLDAEKVAAQWLTYLESNSKARKG